MLTELSPLMRGSKILTKPEDLLLQKGSWVSFSNSWPASDQQWASGKSFEVANEPLIVNYPISRIAPTGHYCDLDLSNLVNQAPPAGSLQLYPTQAQVLYQVSIGLKPGNYFIQVYIPSGKFIYTVGSGAIFPDLASATFRYLGAKYPKDSPAESPTWFIYTVYNMTAVILRLYAEGPDFEKMSLEFKINKCQLVPKALTDEQRARALMVQYYTDLVGF